MNKEEIKKDLILELIHIIEKPEDSNKAWKDAIIVSAKEYLQSLESEETEEDKINIEQKVRTKLLLRGFTKEKLLNNRGLIGAAIDETILEISKIGSLESEEEAKCLIKKCNNIFIYKDGYCRRCYDLLKDYQ